MTTLLPPTMDFVFKKIFGNENHKEVLISFLNAIIKPTTPIVDVTLKNTEINKTSPDGKESRLDVRATLDDGKQVNIEVQNTDKKDMHKRSFFYWSKMFNGQIKQGENYSELKKTICINILGFNFLDEEDAHNVYRVLNVKSKKELGEYFEVHFLEIPKLPSHYSLKELKDHLDMMWLSFLKLPDSEDMFTLSESVPALKTAQRELSILSQDKDARELFEVKEKERRDKFSEIESAVDKGLKQGREQGEQIGVEKGLEQGLEQGEQIGVEKGLEQGKLAMAVTMKEQGIEHTIIANVTGLSVKKIKDL